MNKLKIFWSILGVFLLSLLIFVFILKTKRSEIFNYDVSKNYHYTFKNAEVTNLQLNNGKVTLPAHVRNNKTAFLKVEIKSSFLKYFFSPHIELKSKNLKVIDFFEYGGSGNRYLNISTLLNEESNEVKLNSKYLKILDPNIELISYTNSIKSDSKILVISPHPDDAEIAAFGLYSKFPDAFVLTITAGENGPMDYNELFTDSLHHYLKKGQIRTINSISVPLLAGISHENVLNLGYFDGALKEMHDNNPLNIPSPTLKTEIIDTFRSLNISHLKDSLTGASNWNSLVQNLQYVLNLYQPDIIVLPHPHMDSHSDHKFSSIGTIQALKNLGMENGELFFYSNHQLVSEFFPFGNTGGTISLPPNFDDDYFFNSIYSHPLTYMEQMEKVLALDAMNDLRPNTEWRFWDKLLKLSYDNFKATLKGHQNSYFKRAIRSNELFFVVPIKNLYDKNTLDQIIYGKNFVPN